MASEAEPNEWNSDEALEAMTAERTVMAETYEEQTRRILRESAPTAAAGLVHIALHGSNENTRLNAQKYLVDMAVSPEAGDSKATWENLVDSVTAEVELHANAGGE